MATLKSNKSDCDCAQDFFINGTCNLPRYRMDTISGGDKKYLVGIGTGAAATPKGKPFPYNRLCGATINLSTKDKKIQVVVGGQASNPDGVELCKDNYNDLLKGKDGEVTWELVSEATLKDYGDQDTAYADYDCPTKFMNDPWIPASSKVIENIDGSSKTIRLEPHEKETSK